MLHCSGCGCKSCRCCRECGNPTCTCPKSLKQQIVALKNKREALLRKVEIIDDELTELRSLFDD